jgi:peptidoglycan/xylan/chitin deacetylase (PgdA/CDA1 family)
MYTHHLLKKSQNGQRITASTSNHNSSIASVLKYLQGNTNSSSTSQSSNNNAKVVIINFDDSHKSQYTYAKPILDKYGFKATFFEVCNWVEAGHHNKDMTTTWKDITALQQDGMDIEAHTMNHPHINESSFILSYFSTLDLILLTLVPCFDIWLT